MSKQKIYGFSLIASLVLGLVMYHGEIANAWVSVGCVPYTPTGSVTGGNAMLYVRYGSCPVKVTFASYSHSGTILPYENQVLFDSVTSTYGPGTYNLGPLKLDCNWQTDLYTGDLITKIPPAGISPTGGQVLIAGDYVEHKICGVPQQGRIIVDKVTYPAGDPTSFTFSPSFGSQFTLTDLAAPYDSGLIGLGPHAVFETIPTGWTQTSATCSNGSPVSWITLKAGETVKCTFVNTKQPQQVQKGHLIVQKTTYPAGSSAQFSIMATGSGTITGGGAGIVTDAMDKDYEVTPGTYSVTETVPSDWVKNGDTCQNVIVGVGETKTCLLTNIQKVFCKY